MVWRDPLGEALSWRESSPMGTSPMGRCFGLFFWPKFCCDDHGSRCKGATNTSSSLSGGGLSGVIARLLSPLIARVGVQLRPCELPSTRRMGLRIWWPGVTGGGGILGAYLVGMSPRLRTRCGVVTESAGVADGRVISPPLRCVCLLRARRWIADDRLRGPLQMGRRPMDTSEVCSAYGGFKALRLGGS